MLYLQKIQEGSNKAQRFLSEWKSVKKNALKFNSKCLCCQGERTRWTPFLHLGNLFDIFKTIRFCHKLTDCHEEVIRPTVFLDVSAGLKESSKPFSRSKAL